MSESIPARIIKHIKAGIVAYGKIALWKRDAEGEFTPASALASPQVFSDTNASSLTGLRGGSIVSDGSADVYVANASGVPKKVLKAGDSFTYADSVVSYWGDGNDIGATWDGTRFVWSQAAANSEMRYGVDGAGIDQMWYGDTASAYLQWDQSADTLIFGGTAKQGVTNRSIGASTAAAGTTTADAGVLPAGTAPVYPTTAADGTKGVRINAADQVTGRTIFIGNGVGNQILKVYAPSGGNINGLGADAAFSSASGKGVIITCLDSAGNTWLAW